jgi:hypothetical protein
MRTRAPTGRRRYLSVGQSMGGAVGVTRAISDVVVHAGLAERRGNRAPRAGPRYLAARRGMSRVWATACPRDQPCPPSTGPHSLLRPLQLPCSGAHNKYGVDKSHIRTKLLTLAGPLRDKRWCSSPISARPAGHPARHSPAASTASARDGA